MNPLETISAAASRLQQEAEGCRDRTLSVRLREVSATIRGALAMIQNALDPPAAAKEKPVRRLLVGDEDHD